MITKSICRRCVAILEGRKEHYEVAYRINNFYGPFLIDKGGFQVKDNNGKPFKITGMMLDIFHLNLA